MELQDTLDTFWFASQTQFAKQKVYSNEAFGYVHCLWEVEDYEG